MSTATWDRRQTDLELPEEINLQVEIANVGSRTLAILLDVALVGLVLIAFYSLIELLAHDTATNWISHFGGIAITTIFLVLVFVCQWGYFNFFEWVWNGQTPGKRMLNLRVIKDDGAPVGWSDVFLRNVSRPFDTFPFALVGLVMIFVTRRAQRPGDIMARTLVIHETKIDWSIFDEVKPAEGASASAVSGPRPVVRLTPPEWELLQRFLHRREQLDAETRARLARSLYEKLKPAARGTDLELSTLAPESWLIELAGRS